MLTATMHEKVQLLTQEGKVEQAFDYPVSYELDLQWQPGAGWLISSITELAGACSEGA